MKTIGLIGGTSWHSTVDYYRIINQSVNEKLGGLASAKILMYSVNFEEFKKLADENKWDELASFLCATAKRLQDSGADCIVICANTPHKVAGEVQKAIRIPLIHIAEVTAAEIRETLRSAQGDKQKIGLLGTKFTMEDPFFTDILTRHGFSPLVPDARDRAFIHRSIFDELALGILKDETKKKYLEIIQKLVAQGAEGIIMGCTEIPLLIKPEDCTVRLFDTTLIHAKAAVEFALK